MYCKSGRAHWSRDLTSPLLSNMSSMDVVSMTFDAEPSGGLVAAAPVQAPPAANRGRQRAPGPSRNPRDKSALQERRAELDRDNPVSKSALSSWVTEYLLLMLSMSSTCSLFVQVQLANVARIL